MIRTITFLALVVFFTPFAYANNHYNKEYYTIGVTTDDEIGINTCPSKEIAELVASTAAENPQKSVAVYSSRGCEYKKIRFTPVRQIGDPFLGSLGLIWRIAEAINENDPQKSHIFILTVREIRN